MVNFWPGQSNTTVRITKGRYKRGLKNVSNGPTVKSSNDICPFANIPVPKEHPDRRVLVVNNEKVVIFGSKLAELFRKAEIEPPKLIKGKEFDIIPFIREEVVSALNEKQRDAAIVKLAMLINTGNQLGVNVNVSKRITLKTK